MLRLNKMTDYAVVMMAQMACQPERVRTAQDIARATGVPSPSVSKLLKALARGRLLESQRGASGGYRLARPAGRISIAAIIDAVEGPISLTACVEQGPGCCEVEEICPMRGGWDRVNQAVRTALEEVSLADMVGQAHGLHDGPGQTAAVTGAAAGD
jgi:FeS assembly SUF system regulator